MLAADPAKAIPHSPLRPVSDDFIILHLHPTKRHQIRAVSVRKSTFRHVTNSTEKTPTTPGLWLLCRRSPRAHWRVLAPEARFRFENNRPCGGPHLCCRCVGHVDMQQRFKTTTRPVVEEESDASSMRLYPVISPTFPCHIHHCECIK